MVVVRYEVRPDRAAENESLVRAVFDELAATRPAGLGYATFVLEDGVSFVHVAVTDDGGTTLPDLAAFRRFTENLGDRAVAPPVVVPARQVGGYGSLGG